MNILVIPDTHIPYEHKHFLEFCVETKKKFKCQEVIHIGDLVDNHAVSFHDHDPDLPGPGEEIKIARKKVSEWQKAFPSVRLCLGNHDELIARKAFKYGFSRLVVKTFEEIWEFPRGWELAHSHFMFGVKFFHGTGYGGQYAHIRAVINNRQSCVIGHLHSNAGVEWTASDKDILFGLAVGCGLDRHSRAFLYGRDFVRKPILGCGVVFNNGKDAQFVPMKM